MQKNDHIEEDYLKEMAPTLFSAKHKIPSDAPEGYFDTLPGKILQRIENEKEPAEKGRVIRLINFRNIAIAASLALILALIPFIKEYAGQDRSQNSGSLAEMDLDYGDDTTIEIIENMVEYEAIYASMALDEELSWELAANIGADDIADYLMDENLNEEILIETVYKTQ